MRGGVSSHDLFHTYSRDDRVVMNEVIKDNIPGSSTLGGVPLYNGYPDESTDYNRIYNIKDLKEND